MASETKPLTAEDQIFMDALREQITKSASTIVDYEDAGKLLCIVDDLLATVCARDATIAALHADHIDH